LRLIKKFDIAFTKAFEEMHCAMHPYVMVKLAIEVFAQIVMIPFIRTGVLYRVITLPLFTLKSIMLLLNTIHAP
jgi:hypothetical protein